MSSNVVDIPPALVNPGALRGGDCGQRCRADVLSVDVPRNPNPGTSERAYDVPYGVDGARNAMFGRSGDAYGFGL